MHRLVHQPAEAVADAHDEQQGDGADDAGEEREHAGQDPAGHDEPGNVRTQVGESCDYQFGLVTRIGTCDVEEVRLGALWARPVLEERLF